MLLFIVIFFALFLVVLLCVGLGQAFLVTQQKNQIRAMLRRAESEAGKRRPDLLKSETENDALAQKLDEIGVFQRLGTLVEQSGLDWTTPKFLILTLGAALIGFFLASFIPPLSFNRLAAPATALLFSCFPLFLVLKKRSKRMSKFEEQLPEALNFLSRSMRAGHAFSIGLEMLVADSPEPLAFYFRRVLNDLHLGSNLDVALGKLVSSVPVIDVRFFVSAVLLQQGTGGNLSEILDTMANIIRERFRLKGQIKAASAHGRITGLVLAIMPVVVALCLLVTSPDYLMVLVRDPDGKHLLIGAAVGQVLAYFCIRKIVDIKV
jgi:tight adherence protein B